MGCFHGAAPHKRSGKSARQGLHRSRWTDDLPWTPRPEGIWGPVWPTTTPLVRSVGARRQRCATLLPAGRGVTYGLACAIGHCLSLPA
eukprot:14986942-Heterocapsa_arctica.AAC.1